MLAGETTPLGASETGFRADPSTRLTNPASDHFNSGRIGDRRGRLRPFLSLVRLCRVLGLRKNEALPCEQRESLRLPVAG